MEVDREKMKCGREREGGREGGEPVLEPTLVAGGMAGGTGRWEVGVSVSLPIKDAALCCEVLGLASFFPSFPLTPIYYRVIHPHNHHGDRVAVIALSAFRSFLASGR